jgi:hypothetical protein
MKVYIQDPSNLSFLCQDNTWSKDLSQARLFGSSAEAMIFCARHIDKPFQLLVRFSDSQFDVILPGSKWTGGNNSEVTN